MMNSQVHQSHFAPTLLSALPLYSNFIHGNQHAPFLSSFGLKKRPNNKKNVRRLGFRRQGGSSSNNIKAISSPFDLVDGAVTDTVTAAATVTHPLSSRSSGSDELIDLTGKPILLEFVSAKIDPKTGDQKPKIKEHVHREHFSGLDMVYECEFEVRKDFGEIGAIIVENGYPMEIFLHKIVLHYKSGDSEDLNFTCNSWIQPHEKNNQMRVFFNNKSYLPSQTPSGLKDLRAAELENLRGNGVGERKTGDRVYDYDFYNDLGNPDKHEDLKRPVLGGKERPYPRRCRTGRPHCDSDQLSEKKSNEFYVPRDEEFSSVKDVAFNSGAVFGLLRHTFWPSVESSLKGYDGFQFFSDIGKLFGEGNLMPSLRDRDFWTDIFPKFVFKALVDGIGALGRFEMPKTMLQDEFFWLRDEEFARQTLAGLNPLSIKLVKEWEWPLKSELDPRIYGPPESAITTDLVEQEIKGIMTFYEALHQNKLFIIDYHDILLPYTVKVRKIEDTTLYGSRALFFLTPVGTLKPLAIELVRPPMDGKLQWKQVFTPSWHSTSCWLWRLAKAHFLAHDAGYHQLVSHWLRTHCAVEPYVIATNRQLSAMHPIFRLLHPHLRYTMEINAKARQQLISADGIIEKTFSPHEYSLEISSVVYHLQWRFDHEALPNDLISRGLAELDKTTQHGLKLTIEDYPYANDGLLIWDALKQWVSDYVNHYYPDASFIECDTEIQKWWTEIRTVGHRDKKDESWWPELKTPGDLIEIITSIVWVASGHHAAVNFGQYVYGAYFPNRPTIARINMPNEDPTEEEWKAFLVRPVAHLLKTFPKQSQALLVIGILDVLSSHSPDEEYLGKTVEASWEEDDVIVRAFNTFKERMNQIDGIIDRRNGEKNLRNRHGAGVLPYELLKPFSDPGVTGKGVPNSISI